MDQAKSRMLFIVVLISFLAIDVKATLTPDDRPAKNKIIPNEASEIDLHQRGLVVTNPRVKDILREHEAFTKNHFDHRNFNNSVLGYVTPWNGAGYDNAKLFAKKFTHISPVWLQLKLNDDEETTRIEGTHDIDTGWMRDLRKANPDIKIVPRVMLDNWYASQLIALLTNTKLPSLIGRQLVELAKKHEFDGFVLEMWSSFAAQQKPDVIEIISKIYAHFKKNKLLLILVVPPPLHYGGRIGLFVKDDAERLAPHVHGFSLMTYDYSNAQRPGPNSPLKWVKECINALAPRATSPIRKKLFVGLNFYGYDYSPTGGSALVASQYLGILEKHKPKLVWDPDSGEHYLEYKSGAGRNHVFFPSLMSIQKRVDLLRDMNTGISIWELGQGLKYFHDLL